MLRFSIALFMGCIFFAGCVKKEIPAAPVYLPVSEDVKANWFFKTGSYWIVKDSVKAITDSIYITSAETKTISFVRQNIKYNSEEISIIFSNPNIFPAFTLVSNVIQTSGYTIYNTNTLAITTLPNDGVYFNKTLASFSAGGNNYPSIRAYFFKYSLRAASAASYLVFENIFWCTGVGIVKRVTFPGFMNMNTYEVLRYKIVK